MSARVGARISIAALLLVPAACGGGGDAAPPVDGQPAGFELTAARVTAADGEVCDLCLWLADSPDRRRQGLIGVTDLGPADGMVFRYDEPSPSAFHMRGAPLPLSIAFFSDGAFIGALDMTPCMDTEGECPVYLSGEAITDALEVPMGELAAHGIGPGSRLEVLAEPCPAASTSDDTSETSVEVSAAGS